MPVDPSILSSNQPDPMDDDRACSQCGYSLKGLPRGGSCPECGTTEMPQEPARLPGGLPRPIKAIQQCASCGYPLKGLPPAGMCPECGSPYRPGSSGRRHADLIEASRLVSTRFRTGLMLLIAAIASALFMQVIVLFYRIGPDDYTLVMTMSSIVWATGLGLVLVRRVASRNMFLRIAWLTTLASQWLWPLAFAWSGYAFRHPNAGGGWDIVGILICDMAATIGTFSSLCFLAMICRDLYLRRQASRLELVALVFPFYAAGIWIFPYPAEVKTGLFNPGVGFAPIIYVFVLLPWWALFVMAGLALKDILVRSNWERRIAETNVERVRRKIEKDAGRRGETTSHARQASVDPPEVDSEYWQKSGDIPLSPSEDTESE